MNIYDTYHSMVNTPAERFKMVRELSLKASKRQPKYDLPNGYKIFYDDKLLQIIFQSIGCRWQNNGSCAMCSYGAGTRNLEPSEINGIFKLIMEELKDEKLGEVLVLDSFGSILDEYEISSDCFDIVLDNVKQLPFKKIVFETRPETVTEEIIEKIKKALRSDQIVSFEFGIENEDALTNGREAIGKKFACDWREKVKIIQKHGCLATANIIIGVPFYSVAERNQAAVSTIHVCEQFFDHIVLFPINVKPNTLVWDLYNEGTYQLVSRWDVISVLAKLNSSSLNKIHLTYYGNKGLACNIKPLDCPVCHEDFEKFFAEFMMDYDGIRRYELVQTMAQNHHCSCEFIV